MRTNRGDDREHALDESTSAVALGSEASLAPEDCGPKCPFGRIVRGFDAIDIDEGPECTGALDEVIAESHDFDVPCLGARSEKLRETLADGPQSPAKPIPISVSVAERPPLLEGNRSAPPTTF